MKTQKIVVLSHTEIPKDNRIMKTIRVMLTFENIEVLAVGRELREDYVAETGEDERLRIISLKVDGSGWKGPGLRSRLARWLAGSRVGCSILQKMILARRRVSKFAVIRGLTALGDFLRLIIFNLLALIVVAGDLFRGRAKLIYCNDDYLLLAAVVLKWFFSASLVYDAHELEHDKNSQSPARRRFTRAWEKLYWTRVDHFITVSEAIRNHYFRELGVRPSTVVLNSPAISVIEPASNLRAEIGAKDSDTVLVYVGSFSEGRGIEFLLDWAQATNESWKIVFLGDGKLRQSILETAKRIPHVFVLPPVPHYSLVSYIRTADVGLCLLEPVSLSDRLSLPNKFFEYCFAGLPIAFSDFPEMARLSAQLELGVAVKADFDKFEAAIKKLAGKRTPLDSLWSISRQAQDEKLANVVDGLLRRKS